MIGGAVLALISLAMTEPMRQAISAAGDRGIHAVFAGRASAERVITLEETEIYALQLGAYEDGGHAQQEQSRLTASGIPCIIWQDEAMRIIVSAALTQEAMSMSMAKEMETFAIRRTLPELQLRLSAGQEEVDAAASLLLLPDGTFARLHTCGAGELTQLIAEVRASAIRGQRYQGHPVCAQLAQSLSDWCTLMEHAAAIYDGETALCYAQTTMCVLCMELRRALQNQANASSTASAQRTPSTAADVMPPA